MRHAAPRRAARPPRPCARQPRGRGTLSARATQPLEPTRSLARLGLVVGQGTGARPPLPSPPRRSPVRLLPTRPPTKTTRTRGRATRAHAIFPHPARARPGTHHPRSQGGDDEGARRRRVGGASLQDSGGACGHGPGRTTLPLRFRQCRLIDHTFSLHRSQLPPLFSTSSLGSLSISQTHSLSRIRPAGRPV